VPREPTIRELKGELARRSYYQFFLQAWSILEPDTDLDDNWHIKYLCDLLQREVERIHKGEVRDKHYIINICPRSGKSYIVNIMLAPWIWINYPSFKIVNTSFSGDLSTKLCLDSRRLIYSEWYQSLWGSKFNITTDMNTKSWYENDERGYRKSTSTGAQITGSGADIIIVDDPQDPEKGESETERETVKRYYGKTLYSRLNNQQVGLKVVIQQRLHEDDLTGHLLSNDADNYHHICIPVEETEDISPPKLRDYYVNGLFCPVRFPRVVLNEAKRPTNLGSYGFSGQMLQKPSPPEGGTFKRYWWNYWKPSGVDVPVITVKDENGKLRYPKIVDLPGEFQQVVDSWDFALDGNLTSDDVAGSKWSKIDANKYLLGAIVDKLNYPDSKKALKELYYNRSDTSAVLIERAANGPAVKSDLENEIPGIIDIPTGKLSKEEKVKYSDTVPYASQVEAGNIFLPHPALHQWVNDWIEEHALFPKGAQDGRVDSGRQAVNYLTTAKHIWNTFSASNVHKLDINWENTYNPKSAKHFGAIVQLKDLSIWFLEALWDDKAGKLFVYGCWNSPESNPSKLVPKIIHRMKLTQFQVTKICTNDLMWKNDGYIKSSAVLYKEEFRKRSINPKMNESFKYDLYGSITAANQMFEHKDIFVSKGCSGAARQFAGWTVAKGKPSEDDHGYCLTLCLIISELRRLKLVKDTPKPKPDYFPIEKEQKFLAKKELI
jgi:predicted phage terminase large subunit-like protein